MLLLDECAAIGQADTHREFSPTRMETPMKNFKTLSNLALAGALAMALTLAGCGGGDEAPVAAAPAAGGTGTATGTLTDAAVGGVSYTTSSGVTGTTAADGSYNYNPGDTVTFRLGGATLGTVTATGVVTPMELADGSAAKLQNLLVLLQSLDADGNPANGIAIPAAAAAAVGASVNLGGATATFAADAGLQAAMTAGGITGAPTSTSAANAHFISQGLGLLSGNIWVNQSTVDGHTHTVILNIKPDGSYLHAEAGLEEDGAGHSGAEFGTLTVAGFTTSGYGLTSTIGYDGNGEWGASHLQACDRFRSVGDQLITSDCESSRGVFSKMDNVANSVVGAWSGQLGSTTIQYYLFANGTLIHTYYYDSYAGLYAARYTVSGSTLVVTSDDHPGESESLSFALSSDGKQLTVTLESEAIVLTRISR